MYVPSTCLLKHKPTLCSQPNSAMRTKQEPQRVIEFNKFVIEIEIYMLLFHLVVTLFLSSQLETEKYKK